jgi:hypothetical protein
MCRGSPFIRLLNTVLFRMRYCLLAFEAQRLFVSVRPPPERACRLVIRAVRCGVTRPARRLPHEVEGTRTLFSYLSAHPNVLDKVSSTLRPCKMLNVSIRTVLPTIERTYGEWSPAMTSYVTTGIGCPPIPAGMTSAPH